MIVPHMPSFAALLHSSLGCFGHHAYGRGTVMRAMTSCLLMLRLMSLPSAADPPSPPTTLDFNRYLEGRYVYERHCVVCHGTRGDGNGELSKGLNPRPRSFREGMFKFRSTAWNKLPTDDDLRRTITGGLSGTAMGMFQQLRPDELTALIEYLKSFSRRWRKPENYAEPMKFPPTPAWFADADILRARASNGRILFMNVCATCHGAGGDGKGPAASSLMDIWGLPCHPADLRQPHLRCGDEPADVFRAITTGLNGTPMLGFATTLSEDQRWDVIAYIISLRRSRP